MRGFLGFSVGLCLAAVAWAGETPAACTSELLDAIREVESGGRTDLVGDGGRAIGPYQIHRVYWLDAVEAEPSLRARGYEACTDETYARAVVVAYLSRYGQGKSAESLARIHNGGPRGWRKQATRGYWSKVAAAMGGAK